jgi:aryl-alcohol dehydrogenase-like predicted oxidoreductase
MRLPRTPPRPRPPPPAQAATRLGHIAEELGCSTAQLALAWTLHNPHVSTTITGASRVEQVTRRVLFRYVL